MSISDNNPTETPETPLASKVLTALNDSSHVSLVEIDQYQKPLAVDITRIGKEYTVARNGSSFHTHQKYLTIQGVVGYLNDQLKSGSIFLEFFGEGTGIYARGSAYRALPDTDYNIYMNIIP